KNTDDKKFLLLRTTAVAIVFFGTHLNAHAKVLKVSDGNRKKISNKNYDNLLATKGGKIIGKHLRLGSIAAPEGESYFATIIMMKKPTVLLNYWKIL
ncbi:hypothetical protein, partial [Bartonella henselae]